MRGVAVVAYGQAAVAAASECVRSLRSYHEWPVVVATDTPSAFCSHHTIVYPDPGFGARRAKLQLYHDLPADWHAVLYLDADTLVLGHLDAGAEIIEDGWDMVIAPSRHQETSWLWHAAESERIVTQEVCGRALQWQMGVWFAARNERVAALFRRWLAEWERWGMVDQGAFLRALEDTPVRIWALGGPWNGGAVVQHLFGRARSG